MKFVLVSLASIFTEGMTYQDNLLADQLRADGNEVTVIADCYKFQNGKVITTDEEDRVLNNGIRLIRKRYKNILGKTVSSKVRAVKGLYKILESEGPDIIFHHGIQSFELLTVAKYKKKNPRVKLYVDSHADFHNSASNFLSKNILHRLFYKYIINKSLQYIDKLFYVAYECLDFVKQIYEVPENILEFYPLGGIILEEEERIEKRSRIRNELRLKDKDILVLHAGKMDEHKRTQEILEAFILVPSDKLKLILIGSISDNLKSVVNTLVKSDDRINFLGWKKGDELLEYLCACDLYIQPGSQSATMQNALCSGSGAALFPHPSHKFLLSDSVFYIKTIDDIIGILKDITENPDILEQKRISSYKIACNVLDYKVLAKRLYI